MVRSCEQRDRRSDTERPIKWRIQVQVEPSELYRLLTTDRGRESFWAEESESTTDGFKLRFCDGSWTSCRIVEATPSQLLRFEYFGAETCFELEPSNEGCILTVIATNVDQSEWDDVHSGWVSVLLILKAAAEHGIDLRHHDPDRCWTNRFVDQ